MGSKTLGELSRTHIGPQQFAEVVLQQIDLAKHQHQHQQQRNLDNDGSSLESSSGKADNKVVVVHRWDDEAALQRYVGALRATGRLEVRTVRLHTAIHDFCYMTWNGEDTNYNQYGNRKESESESDEEEEKAGSMKNGGTMNLMIGMATEENYVMAGILSRRATSVVLLKSGEGAWLRSQQRHTGSPPYVWKSRPEMNNKLVPYSFPILSLSLAQADTSPERKL